MLLSPELAQEIVRETMTRVGRNINIMDESGSIIASGEPSRIGQHHAAAAAAIRLNETIAVDEAGMHRYPGAQTGVNIPIQFGHRTIGAIGITGRPDDVEPLGQLLKMTTELMIRQNDAKWQEERRQNEIDLIVEELKRHSDVPPDAETICRRLQSLRLPWEPPYQAAIVDCRPAGARRLQSWSRESLIAAIADAAGSAHAIVGNDRPQRFALLLARAERADAERAWRQLARWMRTERLPCRIAVGNPAESLTLARVSFEEAQMALQYAGAEHDSIVARFGEIEARALAGLIPREHGARLWNKLAPVWQEKMTDTITHLCAANLSIAGAAASLGIHRNTMLYRLEQIAALTGYDPRRFEHAMLLRIALWQRPEAD